MKKTVIIIAVSLLLCVTLTACLRGNVNDYMDGILASRNDESDRLVNDVGQDAVLSNMIVNVTHYKKGIAERIESQGSGVIYRADEKYLYVLTNHHVVTDVLVSYSVYTLIDAYDNKHTATLVAKDAAYDLAVLRIPKNEYTERLKLATLATSVSDETLKSIRVLAVGNPEGVHNTVTVGKLIAVEDIESDELNIEVFYHTAPLDHGSSGGGVFNAEGYLVGINYAIGEDTDSGVSISFAVPVKHVRAFLQANNLLP